MIIFMHSIRLSFGETILMTSWSCACAVGKTTFVG